MATGNSETPPGGGGTSDLGKARVLVVEDDPGTLRFVSLALTRAGFDLTTATTAPTAIELLGRESFDVLLADIGLPGMSGFEFLSVVRRRFPSIRVIAMSGAFSVDDIPRGVAADAFYEKGPKLSLLLQIVQAMICEERSPALHHRAPPPMQNCAELA